MGAVDLAGNQSLVGRSGIFDYPFGMPRPLGFRSLNVQFCSVGRPGLDPGTLGVFPECLGRFLSVQICWPDEVQCPPTSTEVLSRLTSWLDNWLDPGSFQGQVTIQFRGASTRLFVSDATGGRVDNFPDDLVTNRPVAIQSASGGLEGDEPRSHARSTSTKMGFPSLSINSQFLNYRSVALSLRICPLLPIESANEKINGTTVP